MLALGRDPCCGCRDVGRPRGRHSHLPLHVCMCYARPRQKYGKSHAHRTTPGTDILAMARGRWRSGCIILAWCKLHMCPKTSCRPSSLPSIVVSNSLQYRCVPVRPSQMGVRCARVRPLSRTAGSLKEVGCEIVKQPGLRRRVPAKKNMQHPAFPRGPPPQYYLDSIELNFAVRMGSGDPR